MFLAFPERDWGAYRLGLLLFLLIAVRFGLCQTPSVSVLCNSGDGKFDAESRSGITLHVGAARDGQLATRSCAATFVWDKQKLVAATGVSQLDVDVFGVDFGDGSPVAALQIRKSDADCCMGYQIYSLAKPPRLLRTITGGEFYSASDIDLDGRIEIWTNDAAAVNGFEHLALGELDSPPTVVLRFAHGQLQDVSAEFQSHFDDQIAKVRGDLPSRDLEDFKVSDGKLTLTPGTSAERVHRLRMTKVKVLEIVWAYLYSGRETDAWRALAEMWPRSDSERVREALANTRARGIHSQAESMSSGSAARKKKHVQIYDAVSRPGPSRRLEVIPPKAILLQRPPAPEIQPPTPPEPELLLDLTIDSAGKIRSAELSGKVKAVDPDLLTAARTWKFIPAFKDGRPVASRLRIAVTPMQ